jgi:hypothetical protein
VSGKILVLARDTASAYSGTSGLRGYGIPYELVLVPKTGVTLPVLNSSTTVGNYGGIILLSEASYDFGGTIGFVSAITAAQFQEIFAYQVSFGVRLVRLDVFPTADFGKCHLQFLHSSFFLGAYFSNRCNNGNCRRWVLWYRRRAVDQHQQLDWVPYRKSRHVRIPRFAAK